MKVLFKYELQLYRSHIVRSLRGCKVMKKWLILIAFHYKLKIITELILSSTLMQNC